MHAWQVRTPVITRMGAGVFPTFVGLAGEFAIDARGPHWTAIDEARVSLDKGRSGVEKSTRILRR